MRRFVFLSLGMLLCAGCADTAEDYEVNKPVITEPVPNAPVQPEDSDTDLDGNLDINDGAADDATDSNGAPLNNPGISADETSPTTSGAIESDATTDEESVTP